MCLRPLKESIYAADLDVVNAALMEIEKEERNDGLYSVICKMIFKEISYIKIGYSTVKEVFKLEL